MRGASLLHRHARQPSVVSRFTAVLALVPLLVGIGASPAKSTEYRRNILDPSYKHDRWVTKGFSKADFRKEFRAYITVFDGDDDEDGDGTPDRLGVPHFVAYEIKRYPGRLPKAPKRPSPWITDAKLYRARVAPGDATYQYSEAFRGKHPNWYVRGHLCMKEHAWRLGKDADWNTHTILNAVPQRQDFNAGIWLDLEVKTAKWADRYGSVWIIAGPIFEPSRNQPNEWLGELEKGEIPAAIPTSLFKIVVKIADDPNRTDVLAFIYSQDVPSDRRDHENFAVSVDEIEEKTGLDFLTVLPDEVEERTERQVNKKLWDE